MTGCELYIKVDKLQNTNVFTANDFLNRVTADSGTFESYNCLLTDIDSLGGTTGIAPSFERIELFDDERISLTSSVQDIADVSKAKTEFTQSFTIPASEHNNAIFKHWYENAIDGGFDQRIKYDGFIEIDTIPFRQGGFALNNVLFNQNRPESYNITFYGRAKSIKDTFKEDNLGSLDIGLNHVYNSATVIGYIENALEINIAYPLFAHDRLYKYNTGGSEDITSSGGSIEWDSLFPAVRLQHIFNVISGKYNINFVGAFIGSVPFAKLWMLYKNAESMSLRSEPLKINFDSKTSNLNDVEVNLTTDEIGFQLFSPPNFRKLRIEITPAVGFTTIEYDVQVVRNGVLINEFINQVGASSNIFFESDITQVDVNDKYTFFVRSSSVFTFTSALRYFKGFFTDSAFGSSQTITPLINLQSYAPQIKLIDLFSGLVKMFNLVILPINENTFEIKPLEMYYNDGRINDISDNVIVDTIDFKKTSMYKNINFNYQDSANILNYGFNNQNAVSQRGYKYGDLKYEQIDSLESSTFSVELPFENPLGERIGGNFQTITFKDKDLNNYVPKPVLIYDNGLNIVDPNIRIKKESGHEDIATYRRFSNDISNGEFISLNWGNEISSFYFDSIEKGLFNRYYANYLGNIFDIKGRLVVVKCHFTPVQLSKIELNDRIIIRDKKYTINKLVVELNSGESTLELLTDFRPTLSNVTTQSLFIVDGQLIELQLLILRAGFNEIQMTAPTEDWISYDGDLLSTQDFNLEVTIGRNDTGSQRIGYINGRWDDTTISIPIIQNA
jgi:hypothetical protein